MSAPEQAEYAGYYSLVSSWEAGQQRDLDSLDEHAVLDCYNDWPSGLSNFASIFGWTNNTHNITIRAVEGHRHNGQKGTGFRLKAEAAFSGIFTVSQPNVYLEYLEMEQSTTSWQSNSYTCSMGYTNNVIKSCLVSGTGVIQVRFMNAAAISNSVVLGNGTDNGILHTNNAQPLSASNCTVVGCSTGIKGQGGSSVLTLKNNVAYSCTTSYSHTGSYGASTKNAASNAATVTPPGSNPITTNIVPSDFTDAANGDYSLTSGSTLKGAGADLSSSFTTDILGNTRTVPWDVGAFMYVGGGGPTPLGFLYNAVDTNPANVQEILSIHMTGGVNIKEIYQDSLVTPIWRRL